MKCIETTLAQALSQRKIKLFISADVNWNCEFSSANYCQTFDLADIADSAGYECWDDFLKNTNFHEIESVLNKRFHKSANELTSNNQQEKPKEKVTGYVYLMENKRNGYTKIGFSKKPKHREKTLQSEEPEIELIFKGRATMDDEKLLHEEYSDKRVRGEWFDLTDNDKYKIMNQIGGSFE